MWVKTMGGSIINVDHVTEFTIVGDHVENSQLFFVVAFTTTSEGIQITSGSKERCEEVLRNIIRYCDLIVYGDSASEDGTVSPKFDSSFDDDDIPF